MDILFIGYSSLLKKRILPVLDNLDFIDEISIAKYSDQRWDDHWEKVVKKPVTLYDNYEDGINKSGANLAYITTTNNSHFINALETLKSGMHTLIDKPSTMSLVESNELISLAKTNNLLVSESTIYLYHPQLEMLKEILIEHKTEAKLITAHFSFPPLGEDNFRYKKQLGGGAFLDTSPYAVSIGRYFFESVPEKCYYIENEFTDDGTEISYSILLKYPNGKSLIGHFGFNTEYINRLNILGEKISMDIDRIFTTTENLENKIDCKVKNIEFKIKTPKANAFELYFKNIFVSLNNRDYENHYNNMYMDSFTRELIKNN